jgi:hypothetical protein
MQIPRINLYLFPPYHTNFRLSSGNLPKFHDFFHGFPPFSRTFKIPFQGVSKNSGHFFTFSPPFLKFLPRRAEK